jgi:hypothetical protein
MIIVVFVIFIYNVIVNNHLLNKFIKLDVGEL